MSANGPSVFEQTKKFFAIFSSCKFESVGYVYLKQHNYLNVRYQNYDNKKFRIFFRVFRSVIFADKGNFREISRWPLFVNEQNDQNHNVLHYEFALLLTREKLGQPARLNKLHQNQNRPALILEHLFFWLPCLTTWTLQAFLSELRKHVLDPVILKIQKDTVEQIFTCILFYLSHIPLY